MLGPRVGAQAMVTRERETMRGRSMSGLLAIGYWLLAIGYWLLASRARPSTLDPRPSTLDPRPHAGTGCRYSSSDDVSSNVPSTRRPATANGIPVPNRSRKNPVNTGNATREIPPYVCWTPICNPRSAEVTTRDRSEVTQGNTNAVPSGISVNEINSVQYDELVAASPSPAERRTSPTRDVRA